MTDHKDQKNAQRKELTGLRRLAKRRWFYPALYLCAASLILTGVLFYQIQGSNEAKKEEEQTVYDEQGLPATADAEVFEWPADRKQTQVVQPFYDVNGTEQEQQAALVNYDQTYIQNTGINIGAKDEKAFTVTAAMSGKVTEARKDHLLGYVVRLQHGDDVETLYQSLGSLDVKLGDTVNQGDKLGEAGTEALNRKMGTHVHFEIRKNGVPVNPESYMEKGTEDVKSVAVTTADPSAAEQPQQPEAPTKDKESPETEKGKSSDSGKTDEETSENEVPESNSEQGIDNAENEGKSNIENSENQGDESENNPDKKSKTDESQMD